MWCLMVTGQQQPRKQEGALYPAWRGKNAEAFLISGSVNEIVRNITVTEAREIIERCDICKTQKKRMDVGKI